MIRVEIFSNQSVQDDIVELIESQIPDIQYTILPAVQGKGITTKKLGDTVWPEMNFAIIAYTDEEKARKISSIMNLIKEQYPSEGISVFFTQCIEL